MTMSSRARIPGSQVGSAEFKARCLELIDHVHEARAEYIVTRHGRPVAKLGPVGEVAPASAFGVMQGTLLKYDQPFDPIPAVWSMERDE
jgi:prevent-host-death family protein